MYRLLVLCLIWVACSNDAGPDPTSAEGPVYCPDEDSCVQYVTQGDEVVRVPVTPTPTPQPTIDPNATATPIPPTQDWRSCSFLGNFVTSQGLDTVKKGDRDYRDARKVLLINIRNVYGIRDASDEEALATVKDACGTTWGYE